MEKIFIVKICTAGIYNYKRVDEEFAFKTEVEALNYLQAEFFEQSPKPKDLALYYCELDCFNISTGQKTFQKCYNLAGELIYDSTQIVTATKESEEEPYRPKFKLGDLVLIKSHLTFTKGFFLDTIGVIAGVPSAEEPMEKDFDTTYLVDFINDRGFLTHCHPEEVELELYNKELPEELAFLAVLSKHYAGIKSIPKEILKKIQHLEVYLLTQLTWKDFTF